MSKYIIVNEKRYPLDYVEPPAIVFEEIMLDGDGSKSYKAGTRAVVAPLTIRGNNELISALEYNLGNDIELYVEDQIWTIEGYRYLDISKDNFIKIEFKHCSVSKAPEEKSNFIEVLKELIELYNGERVIYNGHSVTDALVKAVDELEWCHEKINWYKTTLELRDNVFDGDFWHWMKDEENHLGSLTCPVIINAEDLRELLSKQAETAVSEYVRIHEESQKQESPSNYDNAMKILE